MKGKMLETKFVFLFISVWQVKGDCLTGKCEKISFNEQQHAKQNQELVGHVFHNSVTSNPAQCYLWCINDCRCLSINYKVKNETKYCELNEGNHFTGKNSLINNTGSIYYVLRRETFTKVINFTVLKAVFTVLIVSPAGICDIYIFFGYIFNCLSSIKIL